MAGWQHSLQEVSIPFPWKGIVPQPPEVVPPNPHTSPGDLGPRVSRQRLNPKPLPQPVPGSSAGRQYTGPLPTQEQQSVSVRQTSQAGRQPPRSWQVGAPEPSSAQRCEQQSPALEQGWPAARQPVVETHRLMNVPPSGEVRLQEPPPLGQN
jgi:hypothetical protein